MALFAGNMSLEELTHLRMNHSNDAKLVEQSKRVDGMKRTAKAKRNDYPPGTETWADGLDRWNIDMFDMVKISRLFMEILQKAFAKAGVKPQIVRSNGAGEYEDKGLNEWLTTIGIHHQYSAVDSQYQNTLAKKFLDIIGLGIQAILLQSNLPVKFWGLEGLATVYSSKNHVDHHKILPLGEPGVFVGLGSADNKKAWLVYCPCINKIITSRDVQFDETFFPLCTVNQRVYGHYDSKVVHEMRAANQHITLDQQAPSLAKSDLWDLSIAQMSLEQNDTGAAQDGDVVDADATSDDGSSDIENVVEENPPTSQVLDETEVPRTVSPDTLTAGTSDQILCPNIVTNCNLLSGGEKPAADALNAKEWDDCADNDINELSDFELTEYMVGISANMELPASFYPKDNGHWTVEVVDADHNEKTGKFTVTLVFLDGPVEQQRKAETTMSVSAPTKGADYSLCRAIREVFPTAKKPRDIRKVQANYLSVFGAWQSAKPVSSVQRDTKWKTTEVLKQSLAFAALVALQTVTWSVMTAAVRGIDSPLAPQPKLQRDARA
eukprot:778477-Rhodomonas_salina.2